jgi:hypothetical protein
MAGLIANAMTLCVLKLKNLSLKFARRIKGIPKGGLRISAVQ